MGGVNIQDLSLRLRQIAVDAGNTVAPALAQAFRNVPEARGDHEKTNHHDLVTVHDVATEKKLHELLLQDTPGAQFWGEETGRAPRTENLGENSAGEFSRVQWLIDPIDGTSNFAHGFAMFSVSIAALVDDRVVAAAVIDPANGLEFSADLTGAFLNGERLDQGNIRPAPASQHRYNVVTSFPAAEALARAREECLEIFGDLVTHFATVRRTVSAALELCHCAAGWADVALGVDVSPWDVAAGAFIVAQAGGRYVTSPAETHGVVVNIFAPHFLALAPGRDAGEAKVFFDRIISAVGTPPQT